MLGDMTSLEAIDRLAPPPFDPFAARIPPAQARRGGPVPAGDAARELDQEVTRLLRVRSGELAEPLLWGRPSHRRQVEAVCAQLAPIRSRIALLWSWNREAHRSSPVRLAYAIVWLRLAQRRAGEFGPRTHRRGLPTGKASTGPG